MKHLIIAILMSRPNPQPMTEESAIKYLLRFVPQSAPLIIERETSTSLIARPSKGRDWRCDLEFGDQPKLVILGRVEKSPSPKQIVAAQKAIASVLNEKWKLPIEIQFGIEGNWLTYSLARLPRVPGGARLIRVNKDNGKVRTLKDF